MEKGNVTGDQNKFPLGVAESNSDAFHRNQGWLSPHSISQFYLLITWKDNFGLELFDDFSIKYDIIRTHEEFHAHKCIDSDLVQQRDGPHNLVYAKLLLMFKISVSGEEHDIVFIQDYAVASPADMSEDDKATGFRKLILGGLESTSYSQIQLSGVLSLSTLMISIRITTSSMILLTLTCIYA